MIVMTLSDPDGSVDREREMIVVISNATDDLQLFAAPSVAGIDFTLHEIQQACVCRQAGGERLEWAVSDVI